MGLKRNSARALAGLLLALLLPAAGCAATSVPSPESTPLRDFLARSRSGDQTYRMRVGDRLTTRFFYNPQLDQEFIVRPDGRIQLKLIGELQAAGKSTKEFSAELTKRYAHFFLKSSCVVILRETSAFRVFTAGQLRNPGQIDMGAAKTVLDSLAMSGGVTEDGTLSHVYLIRTLPGAKSPIIAELNLKDALSGEDFSQDVQLMPDDYVFVPLSSMAHLNLALQSYLYRNLNFTTGVGVGVGFSTNASKRDQTASGRLNTARPTTGNTPPPMNQPPPMMNVPPAAATPNTAPVPPVTPARP
jgi:polysaccharide export outer membrane protein